MSIFLLVAIYITFDYFKINEHYTDNDSIVIYIAEYSDYDLSLTIMDCYTKIKK